ncbi:hypothetical protein [Dokdonella immobilis]|uniref:hypothetical protein n=1 Tax=Dokdonella immobilis TaxID=578942 RepID=UPI000B82DAB3|nr:hypothetical protein [Dokdonella immobilis]
MSGPRRRARRNTNASTSRKPERPNRVYAGLFKRSSDGLVASIGADTVGLADQISLPRSLQWHVIGSGWDSYGNLILGRMEFAPASTTGRRYPQAAAVARIAGPDLAAGSGLAPEFPMPTYLRDKVAMSHSEQDRFRSSAM